MGLKIYLSVFILVAAAFLYYSLSTELVVLNLDPIKIKAPIRKVFECYKNRFYLERLWRALDTQNSIQSLVIDKQASKEDYIKLRIAKQIKLFEVIKISTNLEVEYYINKNTFSVNAIAKSNEYNAYINASLEEVTYENAKMTQVNFQESVEVPKLFSYLSYIKAKQINIETMNALKQLLEKDENFCFLE